MERDKIYAYGTLPALESVCSDAPAAFVVDSSHDPHRGTGRVS